MTSRPVRVGLVLTACAALVVACSSSSRAAAAVKTPKLEPSSIGNGEGQAEPDRLGRYAEDGSNDKTVDWVTPFEQKTGCQTNVKLGNTPTKWCS